MKQLSLIFLLLTSHLFLFAQTPLLDQLGITVTGTDRQFAYTNKEAGTYSGEVNGSNSSGWQGWFINAQKILTDYSLETTGKIVDRTKAVTFVFPHQLIRTYPDNGEERLTLLDSVNAIVIEYSSKGTLSTDPTIVLQPTDEFIQGENSPVSFKLWKRKTPSIEKSVPSWIALSSFRSTSKKSFVIAAGSSSDEAMELARNVERNAATLIEVRKRRMEAVLHASYVETDNRELNIALAWAKLSLDALIMNQSQSGVPVKGIFAGLPWFNNYWGRDSFISLPGATFVTGNFKDAREILLSFARFQEKDSTSANYGRIPNIVTPISIAYNTADGTPWFVKQLYEYVKYSNDTALIREFFPVVRRSIEGTLTYHTDSLGFLTHGDAESWMDAVGPNGPWSPRGNRACDVQALWYYQLLIGSFTAEHLTEYYLAGKWKALADSVEKNFNKYFVDGENKLVYDHLNPDGAPSQELRPNQLFCLDIVSSEEIRTSMVKAVTKNLIYEHGVGTLAQTDSNFHPFHHYEPYYVQDAAYHNGIVWTWLNGGAIYALTRNDKQDLTYAITQHMVHQILHRGCVGTLSELLDAHVRSGESEPRLSGTFSQAWSLAEFIRSFYQDYLGLRVDATSPFIRINPKLPAEFGSVEFNFRMGGSHIAARYEVNGDSIRIMMKPDTLSRRCAVSYLWVHGNGDAAYINTTLSQTETLTIAHSLTAFSVFHNEKEISSSKQEKTWHLKGFSPKKEFADITLARPIENPHLPALRGPTYPLLSLRDVRKTNASSKILFDKEDAIGDDKGESGTYQYPGNVNFKPGILDITRATVRYDRENAYFSLQFLDLANPGWHPEYGFQLTFAAIALHRTDVGATSIGENSRYTLNRASRFDRLITVGGGIRVSDERGRVVCEYLPRGGDEKDPIGNVQRKTIEFSIPLEYLGEPTPRWKMTILIGAQDDHGGAGVGEFRAVDRNGGEWVGGGKVQYVDSNVYDVIELK
jgi:glycogen debranching enzyme